MKNTIFSRITTIIFCAAISIFAFAADSFAQGTKSGNVKTTIVKVINFAGTAIIPQAGASLSRDNKGVFATISTSSLTPGNVVTFWWVVFNNPELCATPTCAGSDLNNPLVNGSLQFGGGTIADAGGRANFSGYLEAGDNTGFYLNPAFPNLPNPSTGIVDTKKAQIHFTLRNHGPASADPVILQQQLTSFPGGCSMMNPCANVQAAVFLQ